MKESEVQNTSTPDFKGNFILPLPTKCAQHRLPGILERPVLRKLAQLRPILLLWVPRVFFPPNCLQLLRKGRAVTQQMTWGTQETEPSANLFQVM